MRAGLGLGYAAIGAIGAARQAGFLVMALASPVCVRRVGAGRVILGSMLVCAAALCGLAATRNPWAAMGLLVTLNACAASAWIPMVSVVAKVVASRHQGKAVGLIASGTNYGLCANGALVAGLLPGFGWRSVWLAAGMLTLILCLCLRRTLRRAAPLANARAVTTLRDAPLWGRALEPHYVTVYVLAGLGGLAGVPFANYISAHIQEDLRLAVAASGEAWVAMGFGGAVGGLLLGTLGDRMGLRAALSVAAGLLAASGCVVAVATTGGAMAIAASIFGASFFSIFGLLPAYVGKTTEDAIMPTICGLVECSLGLGGSAGSALGGLSPEVTGSFRPIFVSTALLGFVMVALTQTSLREPAR